MRKKNIDKYKYSIKILSNSFNLINNVNELGRQNIHSALRFNFWFNKCLYSLQCFQIKLNGIFCPTFIALSFLQWIHWKHDTTKWCGQLWHFLPFLKQFAIQKITLWNFYRLFLNNKTINFKKKSWIYHSSNQSLPFESLKLIQWRIIFVYFKIFSIVILLFEIAIIY